MTLIDFILNLVGLLLWLNWRAISFPVSRPGPSLISTLRHAEPPRPRGYYLAGLAVLLVGRALFYWQVGEPIHWVPRLPLGPTTLAFRSDMLGRMLLYSCLSFGVALGILYLWLLLLSWVNTPGRDGDSGQQVVRAYLGPLDRWPALIKLVLPLAVTVVAWCALSPLLARFEMVPPNSMARLLAQGAVLGLAVYLTLKFLVIAFLGLHLLNSYVYLGEFALWKFVNTTARRLLRPWRWLPLQVGKIDFAPILSIVLVVVAAEFAQRGLAQLYRRLI